MSVAHDTITGGHLGIKKTREKIMSNFYWPGRGQILPLVRYISEDGAQRNSAEGPNGEYTSGGCPFQTCRCGSNWTDRTSK